MGKDKARRDDVTSPDFVLFLFADMALLGQGHVLTVHFIQVIIRCLFFHLPIGRSQENIS